MNSLSVTAQIVLFSVAFQLPVSLLPGVCTAGRQKYRAFLTVVYFIPLLLSSAAVAIAFLAVLDPNFGLAAEGIGFMKQNWLGDPVLARCVVVFVLCWQHIPLPVRHRVAVQAHDVVQVPAPDPPGLSQRGALGVRSGQLVQAENVFWGGDLGRRSSRGLQTDSVDWLQKIRLVRLAAQLP